MASGDDFVVIANDTLPPEVALNPNHGSSRTTIDIDEERTTLSARSDSPFPGGKLCSQSFIRKAQATKLITQALHKSPQQAICPWGPNLAIGILLTKIPGLIGYVASALYVGAQIICNYGGGYPAAWTRIDVR